MQRTVGKVQSSSNRFVLPALTSTSDRGVGGGKGKEYATDTGVKEVTDGIDVIKELVLGCVGGVGVTFLAWGLLDFGTGYSAHDTTQQSRQPKRCSAD